MCSAHRIGQGVDVVHHRENKEALDQKQVATALPPEEHCDDHLVLTLALPSVG